jgi:hypothetical protein
MYNDGMNALSDNSIVSAAFSAGLELYLVKQPCLTRFLFLYEAISYYYRRLLRVESLVVTN